GKAYSEFLDLRFSINLLIKKFLSTPRETIMQFANPSGYQKSHNRFPGAGKRSSISRIFGKL
ncbi:MAG: hypothetical protein KAR17_02730, partial [Cyclobacteriaceae bacterium]|nr:hypothetical protein [Cyclobacteriaceae bacterium]